MSNTVQQLREKLRFPDNSRRPVQIIHSYFPRTDVEGYLERAKANGLGGFVVNMDVQPKRRDDESEEEYKLHVLDCYLGEGSEETDETWNSLKNFVNAAFEKGFEVWIYDERGFPSGAAGNKVLLKNPDYRVKGLACRTVIAHPGKGSAEAERGTLRYIAAYGVTDGVVNTAAIYPAEQKDGAIVWDLPDTYADYRVCAFYTREIEFYTTNRVPYVDLMRPDVTDAFIEVTHEAYRRHLGDDVIAKITAFFTDEPGLPTRGCSSFYYENSAVAAWTEEMDEMLGEDMPAHYVDVFFDTDRDFASYRRCYWQAAAKLYSENYFARVAAWCEKYNTRMTGHLYGEETLSMQIGLNADLFGLMRYMQMPGVDRLYAFDPRDVTAEKTASSAAHLYGRPYTMSEDSFHLEQSWWNIPEKATSENRLNSAYYQMQLGISHISSYYGYSDSPDPERVAFEERTARASLFCGTGTHRTDILVLIPMNAAYERFTPQDHKYWDVGPCIVAPHQPESIQKLELAYGSVLGSLEDDGFDFDLIDDRGLLECSHSDGIIDTGYEKFSVLVVFDSGEPDKKVAEWIDSFARGGGKVVAVSTDRPCEAMKDYTHTTFGDITLACEKSGASPVLGTEGKSSAVRIRKSETDDAELWFVHNRSDDACEFVTESGDFTVFTPEGEESSFASDGHKALNVPAKSALMIVRQK